MKKTPSNWKAMGTIMAILCADLSDAGFWSTYRIMQKVTEEFEKEVYCIWQKNQKPKKKQKKKS